MWEGGSEEFGGRVLVHYSYVKNPNRCPNFRRCIFRNKPINTFLICLYDSVSSSNTASSSCAEYRARLFNILIGDNIYKYMCDILIYICSILMGGCAAKWGKGERNNDSHRSGHVILRITSHAVRWGCQILPDDTRDT